jgi:hypothetical protein
MLWEPNKPNNPFGHAAIQTNTYHMSLWPDGNCKEDFGYVQTFLLGVDGSLVYHHNYDCVLEGRREPLQYNIEFCSMKEVDELYEEMLDFNDITHDKVTLDSGNEKLERKEKPEISLNKSKYSFKGVYLKEKDFTEISPITIFRNTSKYKEPIREFYKDKQSCTTFCMNLLLNSGAFDATPNLYLEFLQKVIPVEESIKTGLQFAMDSSAGILELPHFKEFIEQKSKLIGNNCVIS